MTNSHPKKKRVDSNKSKVIQIIRNLCNGFPSQRISTHLAIALQDYPSMDGLSDKELFHALDQYYKLKELDMDIQVGRENTDEEFNEDDWEI